MKLKIGLSFFVLVLFINFFLAMYNNQIDKSSYTDWISAFCNLIMAGATVSAVITARNYLAQFTAQEGYKIAISVVNDDLLKITDYAFVLTSYNELYKIIDDNKKIFPNRNDIAKLNPYITRLQGDRIRFNEYFNQLEQKIKKLHTYGLEISDEKFQCFVNILSSCKDILEEINDILKKASKLSKLIESQYYENKRLNHNYDNNPSGTYFEMDRFKDYIPHPLNIANDKWEMLLKSYDLFFSNNKSITDIFKVKKAL